MMCERRWLLEDMWLEFLQPVVTEEPSVCTAWERSLPAILRYWGRSCTVWVCICLPLLSVSLLFLQGKQGSCVWGGMSWTFFTAVRFSEYKSEAKFCIDFILSEEPRRESDRIPSGAKIHFKVGEKTSSHLIAAVFLLLLLSPLPFLAFEKCFLKPSERDAGLQSCPMWSLCREEHFPSHRDGGVTEKHQSSWNVCASSLGNPLQQENVRYVCSSLPWETG